MSKSIRIRDHLYDEIQRLADSEHRSLVGQLELLLEQALRMTSSGAVQEPKPVNPTRPPGTDAAPDDHFKPDFGKKLK